MAKAKKKQKGSVKIEDIEDIEDIRTMEKLWKNYGTTMEQLWKNYGKLGMFAKNGGN